VPVSSGPEFAVGDMATITKMLPAVEEQRRDTVSMLLKNPLV